MKIKDLKNKILVTAVLIAYVVIGSFFSLPCFIRFFTGVECPGCGMTRAWISALNGDWASALGYHKMFWAVPLLYLCFLFDGRLFRNRTLNIIFYLIIVSGFIVNRLW